MLCLGPVCRYREPPIEYQTWPLESKDWAQLVDVWCIDLLEHEFNLVLEGIWRDTEVHLCFTWISSVVHCL